MRGIRVCEHGYLDSVVLLLMVALWSYGMVAAYPMVMVVHPYIKILVKVNPTVFDCMIYTTITIILSAF